MKTYSELITIPSFKDRLLYLQTKSKVGEDTFGWNRFLNQRLYKTKEWRKVRDEVILRDNGCDLADPDRPIFGRAIIHHINPISKEDILNRAPSIFDLENLITTTFDTHNAIHYSSGAPSFADEYIAREPNDTCPWRKR